jgi:transposase-like protein
MTTNEGRGHLRCPFCEAYEVERLYLASAGMDSCACTSCGARWDEDAVSGDYRGRSSHQSIVTPRDQ